MMKFTDAKIRGLKPRDRRYELYEENGKGFGVRMSTNGLCTFVFRYRYLGKPRRMTLGPYPHLSLKEARQKCDLARAQLVKNIDPAAEAISHKKAEYEANTVAELVAEYIEKHAKKKKITWQEDQRILNKEVIPLLGRYKAKDVKRRHILDLIDGIVDRGAPVSANRTLEIIRRMFNFAMEREVVEITPCYMIKKPSVENKRHRYLEEAEVKSFWEHIDHIDSTRSIQLALKLLLITGQRRGEITNIEKNEIDLEKGWWTIPPEKTKNHHLHRVPLNDYAIEAINELIELSGESPYLFPSPTGPKAIHPGALTRAVSRNRDKFGTDAFMVHDLRRTFATLMRKDLQSRPYVGKVLNHTDHDITSKHYDQHTYDNEKRAVMNAWGQKIESILTNAESNVLHISF